MILLAHVLLADSSWLTNGSSAEVRIPAHQVCVLTPSALILMS